MTSPYKCLSLTLESVTVEHKVEEVTISNGLCIYDPKTEAPYPYQQDDADGITNTPTPDNTNDNPTII